MKKVIVGTARSGTTCAYDKLLRNKGYIDIDTIQYQYSEKHKAPGIYQGAIAPGEWLHPWYYTQEQIYDNILFLQEEKTYGREYSLKLLIPQLLSYKNWFYNFYTPDEVYIIRRRDIWKHYKSVIYQMSVNWFNSTSYVYIPLQFEPLIYTDYVWATKWFFRFHKDIYNFDYGHVLYYEDHDWGNKTLVISEHVDYEKHFINFEEIKNYFNAQYSMYKQTV